MRCDATIEYKGNMYPIRKVRVWYSFDDYGDSSKDYNVWYIANDDLHVAIECGLNIRDDEAIDTDEMIGYYVDNDIFETYDAYALEHYINREI